MDTTTYNYLAGIYQHLNANLEDRKSRLRKAPGHFKWTGDIERINNDIKLIEPILKKEQTKLNLKVQELTGGEFLFIET